MAQLSLRQKTSLQGVNKDNIITDVIIRHLENSLRLELDLNASFLFYIKKSTWLIAIKILRY